MTDFENINYEPSMPESPRYQVTINNIIDLQERLDIIFEENWIFQIIWSSDEETINPRFYFWDIIRDRISPIELNEINNIYFHHWYLVVEYNNDDEQNELALYIWDFDINTPSESQEIIIHESLQEALYLREREVQEIVTGFERHLDAMRIIFRTKWEYDARRWSITQAIVGRLSIENHEIFTDEMADGESQEFIDMTLRDIQEQARNEYMSLMEFLENYPETALSPALREMVHNQIDTYTRMIMGVGVEYNWGAAYFKRKTEEEVRFGILYWVEQCQSVEELFNYYKSWHSDMSEAWRSANALTQRESYPLVTEILNRGFYEKLLYLTWNFNNPEDSEYLFRFVYYLRGWHSAGTTSVWNFFNNPLHQSILINTPVIGTNIRSLYSMRERDTWSIDDEFRIVNELIDRDFANQIIQDYFKSHDIISRIESDNEIEFDMTDPIVWDRTAWQVISDTYESLWQTFALTNYYIDDNWVRQSQDTILEISEEEKWKLIQMTLWIQDYSRFQASDNTVYRELNMVDRFRISSLARFQREAIWQIEQQIWFYNQTPHQSQWLEINEDTNVSDFLTQEFRNHTQEDTIKAFWNQIWQNFNGRNRINPQDIGSLTTWERNLLGIWSDMNGYGGIFNFSDRTVWNMQTGLELAGMIAITAGVTIGTGWLAAYGWAAIWATRIARAGQVFMWNPYMQWAMMGGLSVPISRHIHPEGHDNLRERVIDLWSDYSVWVLTWLLWWAISAKFWRQGAHMRNTTVNATDITLLWFWTEALRYMIVYNYLHGEEEFLWDGIEHEWQWWNNEYYYSVDWVRRSPQEWENYSSFPVSP